MKFNRRTTPSVGILPKKKTIKIQSAGKNNQQIVFYDWLSSYSPASFSIAWAMMRTFFIMLSSVMYSLA